MLNELPALFGTGGGERLPMWLIRRCGHPFLLLPRTPRLATRGVELYPAQSRTARLARAALRIALGSGLPLPLEKFELRIEPLRPFAKFIVEAGGSGAFPALALFAGNPNVAASRLIALVFGADGEPRCVIKAAANGGGCERVRAEASLLAALPAQTQAAPRLLASFDADGIAALACSYAPGHSPRDDSALPEIMDAWLGVEAPGPVLDMPAWRRLHEAAGRDPLLARCEARLATIAVRPALFHGDFAPWNVRVHGGHWTALDWERGEPRGVPGWDWLHYVVQRAVLVERQDTGALVAMLEGLLASARFQSYTGKAGIAGCERWIALAYLLFAIHVLRPTEGLTSLRELCAEWARRAEA